MGRAIILTTKKYLATQVHYNHTVFLLRYLFYFYEFRITYIIRINWELYD